MRGAGSHAMILACKTRLLPRERSDRGGAFIVTYRTKRRGDKLGGARRD
jgi:hypothetical protein